jgi:AraC-like DNA-binding protein
MRYLTFRDPKDRRRRREVSDEEILRWHIDYYQQGKSLAWLAKKFCLHRGYLSDRFKKLGLPISHYVERRAYTPPDDAAQDGGQQNFRICPTCGARINL